jgi:hypothetical protein
MTDTTDYKQIAFKLQSDIEHLRWENSQRDISFLEEMKKRLNAYRENKDTTQLEMVFTMIEDWIIELQKQNNGK